MRRAPASQNKIRIGEFHYVEPTLNSVTGPAGTTRLEPKVMRVLMCLAEDAGRVVTKAHLMQAVWPDTFVGDDVLTRAISELRRLFDDDVKDPRFIQTIPKSGYRLIAGVTGDALERQVAAPDRRISRDGSVPLSWKRASVVGLAAVVVVGLLLWGWMRAGTQESRSPSSRSSTSGMMPSARMSLRV